MLKPGMDEEKVGPTDSEAFLVENARAGDHRSFEKLVEQYRVSIFRMVYYRTQSRMDAEDLTQEVFLQAFRSISKLRNTELFSAWLYRIARNRVRDFHRRKRVVAFLGFSQEGGEHDPAAGREAESPDALDDLVRRDFWKHVGAFLEELPRREREVFTLRFLDQLSIREIVEVVGKNESTVKTHLYRAVGKFRREPEMVRYLAEEGR
jgi:RNA polymerase sigma-70 factor (ECF subfamily)